MTHRKLSDKFKILLAVVAVVAVAAAAITYVALSSNGNDVQDILAAGQTARSVSSGKTQLSAPTVDSGNQDEYTGELLSYIMVDVAEIPFNQFFDVFDMTVTGIDCANEEISDIFTDDYIGVDPAFDVRYAGTYTITLKIIDTDNYEWADVEGDTITTQFVVNRAEVTDVTITVPENKSYSPNLTVESLKIDIKSKCYYTNDEGNTIEVADTEFELYSDARCTTLLTDSNIKAGTVYVKVGNMIPSSSGNKTYRNYRLPDGIATKSFNIGQLELNAPRSIAAGSTGIIPYYTTGEIADMFPDDDYRPLASGNTVTASYFNYGYKISHWFDNRWSTGIEDDGYEQGKYWKVTVNGNVVDPDKFEMKDVGAYAITIEPINSNYSFDGGKCEYSFKIDAYRMVSANFEWKDNNYVYNGNEIIFGADDCVVRAFGDDELTVVLEMSDSEAEGNPIYAGKYTYKVAALEGKDKNKYLLPSGITHEFTVYRQELPDYKATVGTVVIGTFNGTQQKVSVNDKFLAAGLIIKNDKDEYSYPLNNLFGDVILNYPQEWGLGVNSQTAVVTWSLSGEEGDVNWYFGFTHAGNYDLTFWPDTNSTLGANYCWPGGDPNPSADIGPYTWTNFAVIDRAQIDPSIATVKAVDDDYEDLAALIADRFGGITSDGNVYSLIYGSSDDTSTTTPFDKDGNGNYVEGSYYLLVTINDDFYPDCYFKAPEDGEYQVNGKQARMDYEVRSNTVSISFVVSGYTFGDNFASGFGVSSVFTMRTGNTQGAAFGEPNYEFYTDAQCTENNRLEASELLNGLPRNAGAYYVKITVDYTITTESETIPGTWSRIYSLKVAKRQASLAWTVDGAATNATSASFTYSNVAHTVAVANATGSGVPNVTVNLNQNSVTNAGTHTFTATLEGSEADNYTLDNVTNTTFTVTISRAQVTVTAKDVTNFQFGEALELQTPAYTISGITAFTDEFGSEISVAIYNESGSFVNLSSYDALGKGTYCIVPIYQTANTTKPTLTDNQYLIELGNYDVTMVTSSFTVTSKILEVTLHSGMSSQYGETVNLYVPYENNVGVYSTNILMSVEEFKQIVELTATKGGVQVTATKAGIGDYALNATAKDPNGDYEVTVKHAVSGNKQAVYKIDYRQITLQTSDVSNHVFGDRYSSSKYGGYEIISGSLLAGDEASLKLGYQAWKLDRSEWLNVSSTLNSDDCPFDGVYCQVATINGSAGTLTEYGNGRYSYTKKIGNYDVTVITGIITFTPREIELTFHNASVVYGTEINLWQQQSDLSVEESFWKFVYCSADNLRYYFSGNVDHGDKLNDVIDLTLVNCNGDVGKYSFKATVKPNVGYVIKKGQNGGTELTGGEFEITAKDITVTVNSSVNSIIYGNQLPANALDFTVEGLVNGDTKDSLGMTVGIYSGENNVTATISAQNVGASYRVDVTECTNDNYNVTNVTTKSFAITKRTITLTFTANGGSSVYGEGVSADDLYGAAVGVLDNLAGGHAYKDVVTLGATNASGSVTAANAPKGEYNITATLNDEHAGNYTLETQGNGKYTITARQIKLVPTAVTAHPYGTAYVAPAPLYTIAEGSFVNASHETAMQITAKVYNESNADITGSIATQNAGDYTIKLIVTVPNDNYEVDVTTTAQFTIAKRKATVTFINTASGVYGEAITTEELLNVVCTIEGLLGGDSVTLNVEKDGVSATADKAPVGAYTVTLNFGASYEVTYTNGESGIYNITSRTVKIVADNVTHTYGNAFDGTLTYREASGEGLYSVLAEDNLDIIKKVLNGETEVTNFATLDVKAGGYVIELTKGASSNSNYTVILENGTFTVEQREITVTFVAPVQHPGEKSARHSTYYDASDKVDNTLYSNAVIILGENDLVSGSTLKSVLSLTAVNGEHNATETHAPAGDYTITPTVIDGNYKLKDSAITGIYVIGKAQLIMTSTYPINVGTFGYTGEAQSIFSGPVSYRSVNGSPVVVLYKVTTQEYNGTPDEEFFADGTTELPALTDVGQYYVYVMSKADGNHETANISVTYTIVPITITVTAKPIELTYHDELVNTNWYEYEVTTEATVTPYAGLNADVLSTYLDKITLDTNYTTSTSAGAIGIVITPVYDNGSNGDDNVIVNCVSGSITVNNAEIVISSVTSGHATGAYTGEAFNLFGAMNATTVNSQAVTWYYREVGQSNWFEYNNDTFTNVCNKQFEVKATADNHNDKVYETNIDFVITQNAITIKADDKSITYGAKLGDITLNGQPEGSSNGLIQSELDRYIKAVTYVVNSYTTETSAGSKLDITSTYTGDANVAVTVKKGTLTVTTREITVTFDNSQSSVYGDSVTKEVLDGLYSVIGLVNNEKVDVSAKLGEISLTSDKAPAGTYTVTVAASSNYTIHYANGDSGTYEITKRPISVSIDKTSVVYTEDVVDGVTDYHGGEYGKTQYVTALFTNLKDEFVLGDDFTVEYKLNNVAATPNKVGSYKATIAVTNSNYVLTGETAFDYEITKKQIASSTFMWEESTFVVKDDVNQFHNVLKNYIADILAINSFTMSIRGGESENVEFSANGEEDHNKYYFDNKGQLNIIVESVTSHIYTIHFGLNNEAQANYELTGSEVGDGWIERMFSVSAHPIESYVRQQGWQYSDAQGTPVIKILIGENKVEYMPQQGYKITYARVTNTEGVVGFITAEHNGYNLEEVQHLFAEGSLSQTFNNFDVGYYVICVEYNGMVLADGAEPEHVAIRRFDVFEVTKKVLTAPTFTDVTYNGQKQSLTVNYDNDVNGVALKEIVTARFGDKDILSGNSIAAIDAGEYTVIFSIKTDCSARYTWDANSEDLTKSVVWSINKDEAVNNKDYFEIGNIEVTYGTSITITDLTVKKEGYEGAFTWLFAAKAGNAQDPSQIDEWSESLFSDVGNYWIKVVLTDSKNNFGPKTDYAELVINKKTLNLIPSGTLTYGDAFEDGSFNYTLNGFIYGENEGNVAFTGKVTYVLKNASDILNVNGETGYALIANSTLDTANYDVVVGEGKLIVNKRPVTVTIGTASSQYGMPIVLTGVTATSEDTVATNEVVTEVVKYLAIKENLSSYDKGTYGIVVTTSYQNDNFYIIYNEGTYTVTARKVTVTLDNTYAGGTFKSAIKPLEFTVNDDGNGLAALVAKEFVITPIYKGTAYDGTSYNGTTVPSQAGEFKATVQGADNVNFELVIPDEIDFVVYKSVVDSSKITSKNQMYTGSPISPIINDKDYNVGDEKIYNVIYNLNDLVDAGPHNLTLSLIDSHNYAWNSVDNTSATAIIYFVIAGADIYAIPFGNITYGESAIGKLSYRLEYASGANKGGDASVDVDVVGEVEFIFVDKDELHLNLDQLAAGTYRITLKTENGFVVGLKSNNPNYDNIALKLTGENQIEYGAFNVAQREITIKPIATTSVYSQDVTASKDFEITAGQLAPFDSKSDIGYSATVITNGKYDVGKYAISATYNNTNYLITVDETVKHEILPIIFDVVLQVTNGIYNDISNAAGFSINNPVATNIDGEYSFPSNFANLLVVKITGVQNDGNSYSDSNGVIPQNAGSYTVTIESCSDNNYQLRNVTEESLVVAKKIIYQNDIRIDNKYYNGKEQTHGLTNGEGYTVSDKAYINAGKYDVILTLTDEHNYAWNSVENTSRTSTVVFEIVKATLRLTPYGSAVYGNGFDENDCGYTLSGLQVGDDERILSGTVTYSLAYGSDKLTVKNGGYVLVANIDDVVAVNYDIVTTNGIFTVVKRSISIRPLSTTSVYSQYVRLSNKFEIVIGSLVYDDDESVINYSNVQSEASNKSNAGIYEITASAKSDNYDITVLPGYHTINQITVGVYMRAIDGVYGDKSNAGSITYLSTVATNLDGEPEITGLSFTLRFSGKANDGTEIDSATIPTLAGLYKVSVVDVTDENYTIDRSYGSWNTVIEIARKAISSSDITARSESYTGKPIRPTIVDKINAGNSYTVSYDEEYADGFVEVGNYELTLTLNDRDNYKWLDNLNPYITIKFEIVKADNAIVDENGNASATASIQISDWTIDDPASKPQVKLLNGAESDAVFEYSTSENGIYTTEVPTSAGTYWVRAVVAASNSYNAFTSRAVSFVINKRAVAVPVVVNNGASVYTGEMLSLSITNYDDRVMSLKSDLFTKNANGTLTLSALNAGTYTVTLLLRDASSYMWEEGAQLVDGNVVISWTIQRKVLTRLQGAPNKIIVNGEDIAFLPEGFNSGIMTIEGNVHAHEGNYIAVVTLKDTVNYAWEGTESDSITVSFELTGTNTAFIASICVVAGLCVGLGAMALILFLVNRRKKQKEASAIDARSRADGWEGE